MPAAARNGLAPDVARAPRCRTPYPLSVWAVIVTVCAGAGLGCVTVKAGGVADAGGPDEQTGATGGATVGTPGPDGGVGEPVTLSDGGTFVADVPPSTCTQLNIGILGNPGANPSSNFQAWLEARGTTVQRIQTTADVPLTADALAPFDVIVLDFLTRDYTADEAAIFGAWVAKGGGIASMSGYQDDTSQDWRANSLLSQLGVAYSGDRLWGPVTDFAVHPITAGLTSVTFTGGYSIADLGGTGTRTPISFITSGGNRLPVAYAVELGAGKAFVWGDEWIEFDSEWGSQPQIPTLWLQIFTWIAPTNRCALINIG